MLFPESLPSDVRLISSKTIGWCQVGHCINAFSSCLDALLLDHGQRSIKAWQGYVQGSRLSPVVVDHVYHVERELTDMLASL